MGSRRDFIKNSAGLGAAFAFSGISAISNPARKEINLPKFNENNEEDYWKIISGFFPIVPQLKYFNTGTMGPSPYPVIDFVNHKLFEIDSKLNYGGWENCISSIANFVGASENEIALTHNVTEGINILARGINFKKGEEIILSNHEHAGNAVPWLAVAKEYGLKIKILNLDLNPNDLLINLKKIISPKTRVFAVPHIPCTIGLVLPIKEISDFCRKNNILTCIDGAHGPGMLNLNLHDLGCDFYASCFHKWVLGPKGTGFLYVRKESLNFLKPVFVGAGSDTGWDLLGNEPALKEWVDSAKRFFYGSQNSALFNGVTKAIEFHEKIGKERIAQRCAKLTDYFYYELSKYPDKFELLGSPDNQFRAGITAFRHKQIPAEKLNQLLATAGFKIRVIAENNLNANRVSTHIFNTFDDINLLVKSLINC